MPSSYSTSVRKGKMGAAGCFAPRRHRTFAMFAAGVTLPRVRFLLTTGDTDL